MKMVPARCDDLRVFLRLERQDGKNMCAHATQMQLIRMLKKHVVLQAEIMQYPPQSQVQESASAGSEDDLTSGSDVD